VQTQKFKPRVAYGACGLVLLCSAAALFTGSYRAAAIIAGQAAWLYFFTANSPRNRA
jgi:hypothetical protein